VRAHDADTVRGRDGEIETLPVEREQLPAELRCPSCAGCNRPNSGHCYIGAYLMRHQERAMRAGVGLPTQSGSAAG
jgi:hypothetical protein